MPRTARKPRPGDTPAAGEQPLPRPPVPPPGRWRVMQTIAGRVRQYAFTCARCRVTTYVACNKEMDAAAEVVEHCACMGARERPVEGTTLYKVIPNKGRFLPA